jgi:hypothetical protein
MHSKSIEEMATRKMRIEHPELAGSWDEMREAQRRHQAHIKQQEQEKKRKQSQAQSRGQTLGLKQP